MRKPKKLPFFVGKPLPPPPKQEERYSNTHYFAFKDDGTCEMFQFLDVARLIASIHEGGYVK